MILNIEEDLRNRALPMPEVGLFDTENDDIEPVAFVHPNLTAVRKIKLKAETAAKKFLEETEVTSGAEYFADAEYNESLKFWTVVMCLSVDDEPAYIRNGQKYMIDYVENKLGSKFNDVYDDLAVGIIEEVGLKLKPLVELDEDDLNLVTRQEESSPVTL